MNCCLRHLFSILVGGLILYSSLPVQAQIAGGKVGPDSVQTALLPAFAYNSDIGFIGGALYNRIDYSGKTQPFKNYIKSSFLASTKGMFKLEFEYDRTQTFGSDVRSNILLFANRFTYDSYFGIGNNTEFSECQYENDFYFFESRRLSITYEARLPIMERQEKRFDLLFGFGIKYEIPTVKNPQSKFNLDHPNGSSGGWVNTVNTGFLLENRNSEFDPTAGNRAKLRIRAAPTFLFSDYGLVILDTDYRHYFRLFNWITVANRFQARYAAGDLPYWELSTLGNLETLRGYPLNRFLGNSSVLYSLELRKWIFVFPRYSIKLGGHLFTDVGRVFTEQDDWNDLFSDYKQTVGVGGAISLFSPDLILRGEMGFSKDMMRVYVGIGYMF